MDAANPEDSQKDLVKDVPSNSEKSSTHHINARQQVRPKRYKRFTVPKISLTEEHSHTADVSDVFSELSWFGKKTKLQTEAQMSKCVSSPTSNIIKQEDFVDIPPATEHETEEEKENNISHAETCDVVDESEDLIGFIKKQENLLVDELLEDLNKENKWTEEEDDAECLNSEDEESAEFNGEDPVQPGHSLSTKIAVLVVWMFAIMHSLTSEQLSDLLTVINIFLLHDNPAFKSLYRFKNFFTNMKLPAEKHFFCSSCMAPVTAEQKVCGNMSCKKKFNKTEGKEYFISLSIESQLQNFFKRCEFKEGLQHRFKRSKKCRKNIEDVYDSAEYKKLVHQNGPLSDPNNLSFILNTDGVPVFKSSKTSMWPIFLMINELPFGMRKSRDYMILAGLWCGTTKPNMNVFLKPLQDSLTKLQNGFQVKSGNETFTVKGFLFGLSCDIPARSSVLNFNQHNGEYSCVKCLQSGKNYRTEANGNVRYFPYNQEDPKGPERTHDVVLEHAEQAIGSTKPVCGLKGPSVIMFIPHFDTAKGVAIDYMHLVCLGAVRLLLKLWFNVSHNLKGFSLYKFTDIVDSRLSSIKTPHFITRPPRVLSDMKFWKAAELRSWLFYYSIPCVMDLLQPNYLYHYCALVEAIFLLSQSSISENDIHKSEKLLNYFVFMFAHLYDDRYLTINIHSLVHLPDTVRQLGPLWCTSCFAFEGANGELLKMFHGTQYIDMQIVNAVHVYQTLPTIGERVSGQSVAYKFVKSLTKSANLIVNKTSFLGKSYQKVLDMNVRTLICEHIGGVIVDLRFYKRALIRGVTFHSKDYTRVTKRNSYCAKFVQNGQLFYGFVLWFGEHGHNHFACINKVSKKTVNVFNSHFEKVAPDEHILNNFMGIDMQFVHFVNASEELCIVPLTNIFDLCICIEIDEKIIFCEEPNHQEKNL